jgi:hypothetical protein
MGQAKMEKDYLSMAQASKLCPYEQGYLSLLARRGELQAEKIGRNWYTKIEWLNTYLGKKKPNAIIAEKKHRHDHEEEINRKEKSLFRATWLWLAITTAIVLVGFFIFEKFSARMSAIEQQSSQFVPEEITKIPDDQGNFDVYGRGTIKIGKEKVNSE